MGQKILFVICYLLFVICTVKADWVQVSNGLTQLNLNALTSYTSGGVNYIFAGTLYGGNGSGVFVTTNNGNNWSLSLNIPNDVWALANNGSYVYMGCSNGLGITTNNGANWYDGGLGHWIYSLTADGSNVFAGCAYFSYDPGGLFVSTNYGTNWSRTPHPDAEVNGIAINGNYIYSAAGGGQNLVVGVFVSSNFGISWSETHPNSGTFLSFAINGNYIFAGGSGVYISTNNGINWSQTSLNSVTIGALLANGNAVFAGGGATGGGFFMTTDNGTTWIQRTENLPYLVLSLCISNGYVFAGTDGHGVFRRPLSELVGIEKISEIVPTAFNLKQNYPNPFNSQTVIEMSIPKRDNYALNIIDILGRKVDVPYEGFLNSGNYKINYNANKLASGVYFYTLKSNNYNNTKKFVLIK
jgi:hypothetical protein